MGQQIAQGMGPAGGQGLLSPADAAKVLGVSESDVVAALNDGSLKGKKIGTAWRIAPQALDEFIRS
jgi:excisionase family DNA binding protein